MGAQPIQTCDLYSNKHGELQRWPTTLITTQALLSLVLRLLLSRLPNSLLFFPASDNKIKLISMQ